MGTANGLLEGAAVVILSLIVVLVVDVLVVGAPVGYSVGSVGSLVGS